MHPASGLRPPVIRSVRPPTSGHPKRPASDASDIRDPRYSPRNTGDGLTREPARQRAAPPGSDRSEKSNGSGVGRRRSDIGRRMPDAGRRTPDPYRRSDAGYRVRRSEAGVAGRTPSGLRLPKAVSHLGRPACIRHLASDLRSSEASDIRCVRHPRSALLSPKHRRPLLAERCHGLPHIRAGKAGANVRQLVAQLLIE